MKLTNTACKNAKPKDKAYKMFDGGGLFLLVNTHGSKLWRLKYRFQKNEKLMALGSYPQLSLSEARAKRDNAKKLLAETPPIDPMQHSEQLKRESIKNSQNTFKAVALEWHENQKEVWSRTAQDYSAAQSFDDLQ